MLFNSYYFIIFFLPIVLVLYYVLNKFNCRKCALLLISVSSFIFYAYDNPKYLLVLLASILVNWFIAYSINHFTKGEKLAKIVLIAGIIANIISIFYFKYFDFFIENINHIFNTGFNLKYIVLPLGISFFTFQQVSYLVDTYRGETKEYTFTEYMAFVSFFPQLVAGPIVLHKEMISQFRDKSRFSFNVDIFANGLYIFAFGLFKKVILADTFGNAVNYGWSVWNELSSLELLLVSLCYTFEIYFDFSGYCDMAIGIGKLFNIDIPVNFNSPYKSLSINEFWKRWHITLTRFLTNYVYIPLGGNRKGKIRTYINIFIVFIISGLWHGANWTFVLWGALHGIAQILGRIFKNSWDKFNQVFRWLCTFGFINLTWILFRSDSIEQASGIIMKIFHMDSFSISDGFIEAFNTVPELDIVIAYIKPLLYYKWATPGFYPICFLVLAFIVCLNCKNLHEEKFQPTVVKAILAAGVAFWSIISLSGISTFLYFNF